MTILSFLWTWMVRLSVLGGSLTMIWIVACDVAQWRRAKQYAREAEARRQARAREAHIFRSIKAVHQVHDRHQMRASLQKGHFQ